MSGSLVGLGQHSTRIICESAEILQKRSVQHCFDRKNSVAATRDIESLCNHGSGCLPPTGIRHAHGRALQCIGEHDVEIARRISTVTVARQSNGIVQLFCQSDRVLLSRFCLLLQLHYCPAYVHLLGQSAFEQLSTGSYVLSQFKPVMFCYAY